MSGLPRRIGRWRISSTLGAGGMGTVYLGRRGSERAAVKVVHPGLASDKQFRDRFRREVAISRRVRGAYVASVLDADADADQPWLAIAYVPGPTLAQRVAESGPLEPARALAVAVALASALRDIHAAGVHHRDPKPGNVILAPTGPVVIDFGIAAATDSTSLTQTGSVLGSAGWMAPEQVRGEASGAPADVFSWAATVCFAATGRSPFGTGRADAIAYRVAHREPDLSGLPDRLVRAVTPCLAKEPAARPHIASVLAQLTAELEADDTVVEGQDVASAVTALWAPIGAPTGTRVPLDRRHGPRWMAAASGLVVALLVGGLVAASRTGEERELERATGENLTSSTSGSPSTAAAAATASTTTSTTSTSTTTSTTLISTTSTSTTTTIPAEPALEAAFDPTSDADVEAFLDFASGHLQAVVRLDVSWSETDPESPTVSAQTDWEPGTGIVYVPGACPEYPFCGGMEILINDLGIVPDANLYYDSGFWVLSGRFAVQSVIASNGGVMSVSLRAVPIA